MDIQSSALNELFELWPVIIQGWISPVLPTGIADGGIPKSLYDGKPLGLECLVDPLTELQLQSKVLEVDDFIGLYVNDSSTYVTGKRVEAGKENDRMLLSLPHNELRNGVNRLYYIVTRPSNNTSIPSRDLHVLYHLRSPGEPAPDGLDLLIPPDVMRDGVSRERATQGVTFGFDYSNRRDYDRISFLLGNETVEWQVIDASVPVTRTLFADTFLKAGDNTNTLADFVVKDQLGNPNRSPTKRLDVHLARITLDQAILREIPTDNDDEPGTVELGKLKGGPLWALIYLVDSIWQAGDEIHLEFTATVNGSTVATHEATLPIRQVPSQFSWDIPNSKIIADSTVEVRYELVRGGLVIAKSRPVTATVIGEEAFTARENFDSSPLIIFSPHIPHGLPSNIVLESLGGTMFLTKSHTLPGQNYTPLLGSVTLNILGTVRFTFPGLATYVSFLIDSHQLTENDAVIYRNEKGDVIGTRPLPYTNLFQYAYVDFTATGSDRIRSFELTNRNDMFLDDITVR